MIISVTQWSDIVNVTARLWQKLIIKPFLFTSYDAMFSQLVLFQKYFEFFPLKKDRCCESCIARILQWLSYLDTFTEASTAPDQVVAAVNLGEQGPSSVSEAVSSPDTTTIQHIVGDVVSSGRENGEKSREIRIWETVLLNDGSCASNTLLFSLYRIKTFTAPIHYSFKKCSQCTCIFTLQGKSWWAVLHSSKADCSVSNSSMRHGNEH